VLTIRPLQVPETSTANGLGLCNMACTRQCCHVYVDEYIARSNSAIWSSSSAGLACGWRAVGANIWSSVVAVYGGLRRCNSDIHAWTQKYDQHSVVIVYLITVVCKCLSSLIPDVCRHSHAVERTGRRLCGQPHYCYRPYCPTARFRSPSSYMVSDEPFSDRSGPCRAKLHKGGLVQSPCDCAQRQTTFSTRAH